MTLHCEIDSAYVQATTITFMSRVRLKQRKGLWNSANSHYMAQFSAWYRRESGEQSLGFWSFTLRCILIELPKPISCEERPYAPTSSESILSSTAGHANPWNLAKCMGKWIVWISLAVTSLATTLQCFCWSPSMVFEKNASFSELAAKCTFFFT